MQPQNNLGPLAIVLALFLLIVHYVAMRFYIYWTLWWFDMPVHFFGGIIVAFAVTVFGDYIFRRRWGLSSIFSITIVVAVLWEVYEYTFSISGAPGHYWSDTLSDLFFGLLGAVVGVYIIRSISVIQKINEPKL